MGTFGSDQRFKPGTGIKTTPGVGDYDLTNYKNFAKASETIFEIPKYRKLAQRKLERHSRAKSAVNRTIDNISSAALSSGNPMHHLRTRNDTGTIFSQMDSKVMRTSRSRSPAALLGIHVGKRLGGPASSNHNFMMQVPRDARKRLYTRESECA